MCQNEEYNAISYIKHLDLYFSIVTPSVIGIVFFLKMTVKSEVAWFKGGTERNCSTLGGDEKEKKRKMGSIC